MIFGGFWGVLYMYIYTEIHGNICEYMKHELINLQPPQIFPD